MNKSLIFSMLLVLKASVGFCGYYYGPAPKMSAESKSDPGSYVVLQGEDWQARSLNPADLQKVKDLITSYGENEDPALQDAVVYFYENDLPHPLDRTERWFNRNQARISEQEGNQTQPGPYQWLWFQGKNVEDLIIVERTPRAAFENQTDLLGFYSSLGTMSGDESNEELPLVGKHRTINDRAILEVRILPKNPDSLSNPLLSNLLATLTRFFKTMSGQYPAPFYYTENTMDRPALSFSYTVPSAARENYRSARYSEIVGDTFNEYYPPNRRTSEKRTVFYYPFEQAEALELDESLAGMLSSPIAD